MRQTCNQTSKSRAKQPRSRHYLLEWRKSDRAGSEHGLITWFFLGVDPSKSSSEPKQSSAPKAAENMPNCSYLANAAKSLIADPPPKSMSPKSTKHRRRLTLVVETHPLCRSVPCASRINPTGCLLGAAPKKTARHQTLFATMWSAVSSRHIVGKLTTRRTR